MSNEIKTDPLLLYRHMLTGYVFWVSFSALPPMIWFYPLNELDITGYEAFVLTLFFPIVLKFNFVLKFFKSKLGDTLLTLTMILTLLSFQCPSTFWRLCIVAIGAGISITKFTCDFTNPDAKADTIAGYSLAYLVLLVTRIMYKSITPVFNDSYTNMMVVIVLLVVYFFTFTATNQKREKEKYYEIVEYSSNWCTGLGLGSVLYIILGVFGDVSVPFRWTVAPYPTPGPQPTPWGVVILACLIIGLRLSTYRTLIQNPVWSLAGLLSYVVMYKLDRFEGFLGACFLAVYAMSVWPVYANLLVCSKNPANTIIYAVVAVLVPAFYSVWTVAYNFVPLGVYTREFTGLSIGLTMFLISLGLFWHRKQSAGVSWYSLKSDVFWKIAFTLLAFGSASMHYRYKNYQPGFGTSDNSSQKNITVMIWTYHFGYDNEGWPSLDRTIKLINDINADVIGLLETDASRLYMGNNDLAAWLAESLNMYVDYGPATKKHTWGSMLLSKYPILSSEHHLLPSPEGELAPAVSALLDVGGDPVGVIVTHMGNDRDDLDRKLQTLALADISSKFVTKGYPVVFLGYVTSKPGGRDYNVFTGRGQLKDIDPTDRSRFCEYIFYQGLIRLAYARIAKGRLSDTEIQTAKFRLVPTGGIFEDYASTTTNSSLVPENQRYSSVFGDFRNGHYYGDDHRFHMSTPKYFLP